MAKKINFLLLRGLLRESRHWYEFPDELAKRIPNSNVTCLDLPGIGSEKTNQSGWSIQAIMEDLRLRWLEKKAQLELGSDESSSNVLFALSLGAMVAMEWAHYYPEDWQHLFLVNSSASNLSLPNKRIKPSAIAELIKSSLIQSDELREQTVLKLCTENSSDEKIEKYSKIASEVPSDRKHLRSLAVRQLGAASRFFVKQIDEDVKLHFLVSRKDSLTDPSCSYKLAQYFSSDVLVNEKAGHDLCFDDTKWVLDRIEETL